MRLLVVGAGRWGSLLIKKFAAQLGNDNVLVADRDVTRIPAKVFAGGPDYQPLLSWADAVVVATQPKDHFEIARDALSAGKHVLVEKPLTMRSVGAQSLCQYAKVHALTLMTDDTHQYHPNMARFLAAVRSDRFLFASWCNNKVSQAEDPILWVNGPHPVSIIIAAMGVPDMVKSLGGPIHNDDVDIWFEWQDGRAAEIRMTWRGNFINRTRLVFGSTNFDGDQPCTPDPLDRMCAAFIERCQPGKAWQDERGVQVVEVLERVARL